MVYEPQVRGIGSLLGTEQALSYRVFVQIFVLLLVEGQS